MMNIKEYTNEVKATVEEKLGGHNEVTLQSKVSGDKVLSGLSVKNKNSNLAPTVYLDKMFENGMSVDEAADKLIKMIKDAPLQTNLDVDFFRTFSGVKDRVLVRLISDESASLYVAQGYIVRPLVEGLNKLYYVPVELGDEDGVGTIVVNRNHLTLWGITDDELDEVATSNTENSSDFVIDSLFATIAKLTGMPVDMFCEPDPSMGIWVVSNSNSMFGANNLMNTNALGEVLNKMSADSMYILPSSIHEVLCVPSSLEVNVNDLVEMVKTVNAEEVSAEDKLSDIVYLYSRETGLTVA